MDSADIEVLRHAVEWTRAAPPATFATVVRTFGSAPRPVGALLAVSREGRLVGSVSGGCVEDELRDYLLSLPAGLPCPELRRYGVSREEARRFGLPCGGTLELVLERLDDPAQLETLLGAIARREPLVRQLDFETGTVELAPAVPEAADVEWDGRRLARVFGPRWRLLIVGAGQISAYLAQMARALDYQVTVCDPREEYTDVWALEGVELRREAADGVIESMRPDARTAIVALTHDPKLDDAALMDALVSDAFYVGALGSEATNAKRRERLRALDVPEAAVARLHGPVGLPIGSRVPPEIAVSILAEMTAVRRKAQPRRSAPGRERPAVAGAS